MTSEPTQTPENAKRLRKHRDPYFARRMWTIAAVVLTVVIVGALFVLDSTQKAGVSEREEEKPRALKTAKDVVEHGSVEELFEFAQANPIDNNLPPIVARQKANDLILVYRELEKRSEELDKEKQDLVANGLLRSMYKLLATNLKMKIFDTEMETEALEVAARYTQHSDSRVVLNSHAMICAVRLVKAFTNDSEPESIALARKTLTDILQRYPENEQVIAMIFTTTMNNSLNSEDAAIANQLYDIMLPHCRNSKNELIRKVGHGFEGRQLMMQHGVVDARGNPIGLGNANNEDEVFKRFKSFLDSDKHTISTPVAIVGHAIVTSLEFKNRPDKAMYVLDQILERIGDDEEYTEIKNDLEQASKRLTILDTTIDLPDHNKERHAVVLFVRNNQESHAAMVSAKELRAPNLEFIFVTDERDLDWVDRLRAYAQWPDLTLVQDRQKNSIYFQSFPPKRFPSGFVVDDNRKVITNRIEYLEMQRLYDRLRNKVH